MKASDLPAFASSPQCPKCHAWYPERIYIANDGAVHRACSVKDGVEHLAVQCAKCGYEWEEQCADAEG